jgi:HEAT repeat protein
MTRRLMLIPLAAALVLVFTNRAQPQTYLGKTAAEWHKRLADKDVLARRDAAFALGKLGYEAEDAADDLLKLLKSDGDKGVRDAAAYSLGQVCKRGRAPAEVIETLCKVVASNDDGTVKRSCAVALGNCAADSPQVRQALAQAIEDQKNAGVRQNAAWALGEICQRSDDLPVKELRKGLQDGDKLVMRDAALALGKICTHQANTEEGYEQKRLAKVREQGDKAVGDLLTCAEHDYLELRKAAFGALATLPLEAHTGKAVPILARACKKADEDLEVRSNAALCLANIGGDDAKPAVPVLRDALKNGDIYLKRLVALSLRQVGPNARPALPELCKALKNPDAELRLNAAYGLGGLKGEGQDAVPDLVRVVADPKEDYQVRVAAAMSLQTIGNCDQAVRAIPDLVRVLDDPKQPVKVRERVLWALRVHKRELAGHQEVIEALKKVLKEPGLGSLTDPGGGSSGKMLRYDSAFLLSVLKGIDAPDEVLDVLNDFLHDSSIRIYLGLGVQGGKAGSEDTKAGKGGATEKTGTDGRVMALDALGQLGSDRVKARAAIMTQLRAMAAENSDFEPQIRSGAKDLLSKLGAK